MSPKEEKELKCPVCESKNILTSKKDKKRWCRRCGHEWKK